MTSNITSSPAEISNSSSDSSILGELISNIKKLRQDISEKQRALSDGSAPPDDGHKAAGSTSEEEDGEGDISLNEYFIRQGGKDDQRSGLDKLDNNLEQIASSLHRLRAFENDFKGKIKNSQEDVTRLLNHVNKADTKDTKSTVEKQLNILNKEIRKLKHRIPSLSAKEKSKKSGISVGNDKPPEAVVVDDLLTLELSESFFTSELYHEIKGSYDGLDGNAKKCLLCFSVFCEKEVVKRRMLTYWWAGEGLITPANGETIRDAAEKMLEIFVGKGLIFPIHRKKLPEAKRFLMPPVVRSAIVKIAEEEDRFSYNKDGNFMATFSDGNNEALKRSKVEEARKAVEEAKKKKAAAEAVARKLTEEVSLLSKIMDGSFRANSQSKDASIILKEEEAKKAVEAASKELDERMNEKTKAKEVAADKSRKTEPSSVMLNYWSGEDKLRTIFNVDMKFPDLELKTLAKHLDIVASEWLLKMRNLRVLYLGSWRASVEHHIEVDNIEFLKGLAKMKNLRLLSLQGISRIKELTESIKGLTNLEILDLKSCHNLEVLPKEISYLGNLTHLDISNCFLIDHMPRGLSSLTKLQVLKGFVVGDNRGQKFCTLKSLSKMKSLIKLTVIVSMKDSPTESELLALQALENLKKLTLSWGADSTVSKQEKESRTLTNQSDPKLKLPQDLEKLDIQCYPLEKRPVWLSPNNLPKLKKLYIRGGSLGDDPGLLVEGQEWKSVETLRLKYLARIKMNWEEMHSWFPNLNYLEKVDCPLITLCPCDDEGVWVNNGTNQ